MSILFHRQPKVVLFRATVVPCVQADYDQLVTILTCWLGVRKRKAAVRFFATKAQRREAAQRKQSTRVRRNGR